jgi:hypothetical protein
MSSIFNSAVQVIAKFLYNNVRWNSRYRPVGTFDTTEEYCAQATDPRSDYRTVYPQLVTNLKIPYLLYNALPGCTKYERTVYLESEPAFSVRNNYKVAQIPNGRLYATDDALAVVTAENQLLEDVSCQGPANPGGPSENPIFRRHYFNKPQHYSGTVCNLLTGSGSADNYLTWLIDVLPRLHLLQKAGLLQKVDKFVVPACQHSFQKESLQLLGIEEHQLIVAVSPFHGQADLLLSTTPPRGKRSKVVPQWVVDFLHQSLVQEPADADSSPFIYLESSLSGVKVQNEPELKALLLRYGFRSLVLGELSLAEKVKIFNSARIIVSASQLELVNLVFCPKGAKVVEIMDSSRVDTFYYNLASFAGLDYHYMMSKSHRHVLNPNPSADGGVVVETHRLRLLLDKFTGRRVRMAEPEVATEPAVAEAAMATVG